MSTKVQILKDFLEELRATPDPPHHKKPRRVYAGVSYGEKGLICEQVQTYPSYFIITNLLLKRKFVTSRST